MIPAVIAGYARSPFQFARKGALTEMRPDDIAAQVVRGLIDRLDIDPSLIEDVIELNEAFASQAVACIRELGMDAGRVNIDGGAMALGHPLGATGARITGKAADILKRQGGRYALATQCIGGGQGIATILEAV